MKIIHFFIRRRITSLCLNLGIIFIGLFCLGKTSIDLFPPIHLPTLTVTIPAPGLNARDVESKITNVVEERFNTLPHLKNLHSESKSNSAIFILKFEWGTSIDFSALTVRETLKNIKLPDEAESAVIFRWNPSDEPILRADMYANVDLHALTEMIEKNVIPRIERIPGVASVEKSGTLHREIQIIVDPHELSARGMNIFHLSKLLKQENIRKQIGIYREGKYELTLFVDSEYKTLDEIRNVPVYIDPKKPIRLRDIAQVTEDAEEKKSVARISQKPSIGLSIKKSHQAATLDVINSVKKELAHLLSEYPHTTPGLSLMYSKDDSIYINMSRSTLFSNLYQGIGLTVILIFLFLRNLGATLIISISIPASIIGTFALMKYFNVSQNVFSLAGLTLASGMVVDSAVVILENIYRQFYEEGKSAWRAAVEGTQEVSLGVIASVITTMVIFIPIVLCVKGVIGILFKDIAFTTVTTLGLSLIVGFTLIPCASAFFLKKNYSLFSQHHSKKRTLFIYPLALKIQNFFLDTVSVLLDHPRKAFLLISGIYLVCFGSLMLLPGKDLIPLGEFKEYWIKLKGPKGVHLKYMDDKTSAIEKQLISKNEIKSIAVSMNEKQSSLFVTLKKGEGSLKNADRYLETLRANLKAVPELEIHVLEQPKLDTTEGVGSPLALVIKHPDERFRKTLVTKISESLKKIPDILYLSSSEEKDRPEIHLTLDHKKLRDHGLSADPIAHLVYAHMKGIKVTDFSLPEDKMLPIRLIDSQRNRATKPELQNLPLLIKTNETFQSLSLDAISNIQEKRGESIRERENHIPSTTLQGYFKTHRRSLSEISSDIHSVLSEIQDSENIVSTESTLKVFKDTFSDLDIAFIISIILVYIVLAAQFESIIQPLVLLFTLPLASIGLFLGVSLWGFHLDVIVMLGIILLIGLVVDSGILLIEYINILRRRGMDRKEAILTAVRHRMRPIFIVALTDVVGVMPMAFNSGAGSEMYQGFGVVTMFGLATSTLLTLIVIPLVYALLEDAFDIIRLKWLWLKTSFTGIIPGERKIL